MRHSSNFLSTERTSDSNVTDRFWRFYGTKILPNLRTVWWKGGVCGPLQFPSLVMGGLAQKQSSLIRAGVWNNSVGMEYGVYYSLPLFLVLVSIRLVEGWKRYCSFTLLITSNRHRRQLRNEPFGWFTAIFTSGSNNIPVEREFWVRHTDFHSQHIPFFVTLRLEFSNGNQIICP